MRPVFRSGGHCDLSLYTLVNNLVCDEAHTLQALPALLRRTCERILLCGSREKMPEVCCYWNITSGSAAPSKGRNGCFCPCLHARGVAHRDISLDNFLVTADDSLRLTDFAQAVPLESPEGTISQKRGTPAKKEYRPPEVRSGGPYLASKLDTFSIGVCIFSLLAGSYGHFKPNLNHGIHVDLKQVH